MTGATAPRPQSPRLWLFAVAGVLALVLLAVGYVQWRQYKLLDTASHFQNDALGWSFSQLETEQLRLRNQLELYQDDPARFDPGSVQLRYDIFVSRIGLVDHDRAAGIMRDQPAYAPAIAQVRAFVKAADRYLGEAPQRPLDGAAAIELMGLLDALNAPLHDLSLGASHLLYQRATERNKAVRQQSMLGIALTAFQCVLLLVLAVIVLRQLRALTERRRSLEALADNLGAARLDAEAASRAKSAFLANMSHEIRTPFHGMLGMMSLLQEGGLSPQQAIHLDTARESAHHLLTILNDILDLSQLESGRLQVTPQTVDLPQLIAQVDALMRAQAHTKGLALDVEVAPDVPRWVAADPTRVKQILFNLLSNALKFTPSGRVVLGVTSAANGGLEFRVTDTGIGMDEATLGRLFQRFIQGDQSPSRRASGTGLGLQISRDLARLMGGDITVRSQPGVGSTFIAALPLAAVAAPSRDASDFDAAAASGGKAMNVLVAEDHAVNRAYLEAVLDRLGHRAVFAADGDAALRAVEAQPADAAFDVVLMDLHMPGMDGFTAARAIRALPAPRGTVPIVALTADAFQATRQLAFEAGMDGFLTKPAHLPQLREALARHARTGVGTAVPAPAEAAASAAADAAAGDPVALLDAATVDALRGALASAKYGELLASLFAGRAGAIAGLRDAVHAAHHAELRSLAHALKGAALSMGLQRVGTLAGRLQRSAAATPPAELVAAIDDIEQQYDASLVECRRLGLLAADGATTGLTPPAAPAPA
jgi:signal transduction histidine kinase/CheY-like chemotaxis protein/HPt (histidine-containing phosphotransfer) domain-containing protein